MAPGAAWQTSSPSPPSRTWKGLEDLPPRRDHVSWPVPAAGRGQDRHIQVHRSDDEPRHRRRRGKGPSGTTGSSIAAGRQSSTAKEDRGC